MAMITVEHRRSGGNWWLGLAIGLLAGGAVALFLAPYSGKRFREKVLQGVDRARGEVRGTERFGGGEAADPIHLLRERVKAAQVEARRAYDVRRSELVRELEVDRKIAVGPPKTT